MPVFELEANGRQFEIEAPNLQAAIAALGGAGGGPQTPPAEPSMPVSTGEDVARSAGIGLANAAVGLSNIPEMAARGLEYVAKKTGLPIERQGWNEPTFNERFAGLPAGLTPDQQYEAQFPYPSPGVQKAIEQQTGPFYEPQTGAGKVAAELSPFALGAVGRGGTIAGRIGTQVAAPYAAYKGAQAATEGTPYQPAAELAAILLAPSAAGKLGGVRGATPKTATTPEELKAVSGAVYEAEANTAVNTAKVRNEIKTFEKDLYKNRSPEATEAADRVLDRLKAATSPSQGKFQMQGLTAAGKPAPTQPTMAVKDLRVFRGDAEAIAGDFTKAPAERDVARRIKGFIDRQLDDVSPALKTANADYAHASRAQEIQRAIDFAKLDAAAANSGKNIGNRIRQVLKPDAKRPYGYKPNEARELKTLVKGDFSTNRMRDLANLLGGGGGMWQGMVGAGTGGLGAMLAGPFGAAAGPLAMGIGRGVKGLENQMTKAQATRVIQTILSGAPSAKVKRSTEAERNALARLLMTGGAGRRE